MRSLCLLWLIAAGSVWAMHPSTEQTRLVLARLGQEADRFERNGHRFTGLEKLVQIQPEGTRYQTGPRGITTKLPEAKHEVISEYGYISSDERGGSLKEVRLILSVDGLKWKRGKKDLGHLAGVIGATDAKNRGRTLENYESYGLRGFLSDAGQMILLFSRGGADKYEFSFDREETGIYGAVWIYKYRQLDEEHALTIYGGKQPVRQRFHGELWVRASELTPLRITMESNHSIDKTKVHDVIAVDYDMTRWGLLLPSRIDHRQYVDGDLFVNDQFSYSNFKQTISGKLR